MCLVLKQGLIQMPGKTEVDMLWRTGYITYLSRKNRVPCEKEVQCKNLPDVKAVLGKDIKRFDFVIRTKKQIYLIEVNFYSKGGGSKPSEVARAYSELSPKINGIDGYKFVWITDGKGWDGVGSFKEAYEEIPFVYNLTNIKDFVDLVRSEL